MSLQVLRRFEMRIDSEDDVAVVRKKARELAQQRGLDTFAIAAVTTATSELVRNAWTHGGGGTAVLEEITDGRRTGIRAEFRDEGPGIEDVDRVLAGGYSTARSLGLGVSGSRRLVDEMTIESAAGKGTRVTIVKWARF